MILWTILYFLLGHIVANSCFFAVTVGMDMNDDDDTVTMGVSHIFMVLLWPLILVLLFWDFISIGIRNYKLKKEKTDGSNV